MTNLDMNGHRRFLKNNSSFRLGNYIPVRVVPQLGYQEINLSKLHRTTTSSLLFIVSQFCSSCDLDVIINFSKKYPMFYYVLFIEGDINFYNNIKVKWAHELYTVNVAFLAKQLHFYGIPWIFALNNMGQIVGGGVFNDLEKLQLITSPILRVFYR